MSMPRPFVLHAALAATLLAIAGCDPAPIGQTTSPRASANDSKPISEAKPIEPTASSPKASSGITPEGQASGTQGDGQDAQAIAAKEKLKKLSQKGAEQGTIPAKGAEGWHATSLTPTQLASKIDASMSKLSGVQVDSVVLYDIPSGRGTIHLSSLWKSPKVYQVEYPVLVDGHPALQAVRSNGTFHAIRKSSSAKGQSAWGPKVRTSFIGQASGPQLLAGWLPEMPRLVFSQFVSGKHVWVPLVQTLTQPGGRFKVTCEERSTPYEGKELKDYRLLVTETKIANKKLGPRRMEFVIDANHFVPVTIRVRQGIAGQTEFGVELASRWSAALPKANQFVLP